MRNLVKLAAMGAAAVIATVGAIAPASAHGEKSQQAFLRMRTLNWYDVAWSKTTVNVNEDMVLSGKFHVFSAWPQAVANPKSSFLNAGEPGPVLVRTAQFIGENFAPRSVSLVPGNDYAFQINLRGRRAGRWHVHAQVNVEGGGPIIGPGQWIEVKGDMKDFTDPVTLLDGTTVDLEHYGIDRIYAWHLPWLAVRLLSEWLNRPSWILLQPVDKIYTIFGIKKLARAAGFEFGKGIGSNYGPPVLHPLEREWMTRGFNRCGMWWLSLHPILKFKKPTTP